MILPGETIGSETLTGVAGEDGNSYFSPDQVLGEGFAGTKVEYEQVIGAYRDKAYSQIEKKEIPSSMQEIVKEYFSGLGGN